MMMLNGTELKASIVLQAMVTGLLKAKNDSNFVVKMRTYGYVKDQLCYGCAATLTLVEMFGEGRSASELMLGYVNTPVAQPHLVEAHLSDVLQLEPLEVQDSSPINLKKLERAIDSARTGKVSLLIGILTGRYDESFDDRWNLEDDNWEKCIPIVEVTIAEMIAAGY